jgi:hypothetical protein
MLTVVEEPRRGEDGTYLDSIATVSREQGAGREASLRSSSRAGDGREGGERLWSV